MSVPKPTASASSSLATLLARKEKLEDELRSVERQVYDLETTYLHDSNQCGNVLKGFEGFLSSSKSGANLKKSRRFQPEDRLFSLSSLTSRAVEETVASRDTDGRPEVGVMSMGPRLKSSSTTPNGLGKQQQKRGRTGPRDGKKLRQANENEEEEEDPDMALR